MGAKINLVKLCVGTESVADLETWQSLRAERNLAAGRDARTCHVTRMWPRRSAELLDGGSLYWVFRGLILARQPITGLEERTGEDGIRRCAIILDPLLVRTAPQPRRPFQGWRYLRPEDAPADIGQSDSADLPPELLMELAAVGVL